MRWRRIPVRRRRPTPRRYGALAFRMPLCPENRLSAGIAPRREPAQSRKARPSQSRQLQREHFILKMLYQVRVNSFAQCIRNVNLVALLRGVASASSHLQYMAFQTSPALGAAPYANNAATRTGSKPPWTTMGSEEALSLIMFIVLPRTIRASSSSSSRGGRRTLTVSLGGGGLWDAST